MLPGDPHGLLGPHGRSGGDGVPPASSRNLPAGPGRTEPSRVEFTPAPWGHGQGGERGAGWGRGWVEVREVRECGKGCPACECVNE